MPPEELPRYDTLMVIFPRLSWSGPSHFLFFLGEELEYPFRITVRYQSFLDSPNLFLWSCGSVTICFAERGKVRKTEQLRSRWWFKLKFSIDPRFGFLSSWPSSSKGTEASKKGSFPGFLGSDVSLTRGSWKLRSCYKSSTSFSCSFVN